MGIKINQNVQSMIIRHKLNKTTNSLDQAYERLSSGLRVNKAVDDPSGISTSKNIEAQIRGLQQNLQGINNGISLASIAESAMAQITDSIQRIRELAVQAANDTLSNSQRELIQEEVDQMLDEIQRMVTTTDFNGKLLLDGSFTDARIMTGTASGEFIVCSIRDLHINVLGAKADVLGVNSVDAVPLADGELLINGDAIGASASDGVSSALADSSALAKANAINARSGQTGVTATAEPNVVTGVAAVGSGMLDGTTTSLSINGVNVGVAVIDDGVGLVSAINKQSNVTGVTASLNELNQLVLTAEDGRNIQVDTTGSIADELGLAAADSDLNEVYTSTVRLISTEPIQVSGLLDRIGFDAAQAFTDVDLSTAIFSIDVTTTEGANEALNTLDRSESVMLNTRTELGAIQNRLESASNALSLSVENLNSTNSKIVDADYAEETARMTQNQILQQAGIAILAQANAQPQQALDLLFNS
ncbi:flagellin [Candidatus Sumerlaeota bacterium]|nr:flagellin [Candidatus Sumerlaeota bacterium]